MIAQILAILLIPIITRLYSPVDFGYFSLILSISAIIVIFSSLSYYLALMLPEKDEDAANIAILCCILVLFFSIVTGVVFFWGGELIASALSTPEIAQYLWLVPFVVFVTALFTVFTSWNARRKRFGVYALANITNSLSSKGVQIIFGFSDPSMFGLVAGQVIGYVSALVVLLKGFRQDIILFKQVTRRRIKELAVRYKKFPLFTSWSITANTISLQIVPLLLVYFYSPEVVGYFAVASQVVTMPMTLLGSAVAQVFYQKASEIKNKLGKIDEIVHNVHRRLVSIGIFPILLLVIIGEDILAVFLGMQWYTAGIYAKILAPWLFFVFITSPMQTIFSILELQQVDLYFNLVLLLSRIGVLWIGGMYLDPIGTLILFTLTGILLWGGLNFYLLKLSNISFRDGLRDYIQYLTIGIAVAAPLLFLKLIRPDYTYALIVVGAVLGIIYYIIIIRQDDMLRQNILQMIGR